MSIYTIQHTESQGYDTPIYAAGPNDEFEAVVAFTSHAAAGKFLNNQLADAGEVVALNDVEYIEWLMHLNRDNVDYLVIDPAVEHLGDGVSQIALSIADEIADLGLASSTKLQSLASNQQAVSA